MTIYDPREDSFLLANQVKIFSKGKDVLDMCCGSGIQARTALESGAKSVLAVDINQEAVDFCTNAGLKAIKSDLFELVKGKFDLIVCNPPYLPQDAREDKDSSLATSGGKEGDELICDFIIQASEHLNDNGNILLLVSSLTPMDRFNSILKKNNMCSKTIASEKMFMEELYVLLIE